MAVTNKRATVSANKPTFSEYTTYSQSRIDHYLQSVLPSATHPSGNQLIEAMRYAVFNGGKRVRPLLVYATVEALQGDIEKADPCAAAIELIHAYSLVHDDLPAMDDDDLRRGKPACHKAYGEANAILVGDALQSLAFEHICSSTCLPTDTQSQLVLILARAAGASGMAMGQSIDLDSVNKSLDINQLENMHQHKTGALISAAVAMAALCCQASARQQQSLMTYAKAIGLAFQVQDDILDIESDTDTLGKQQGADLELNKPTYPALLGLQGAKQKASELHSEAIAALTSFGEAADQLRGLADYIIQRKR